MKRKRSTSEYLTPKRAEFIGESNKRGVGWVGGSLAHHDDCVYSMPCHTEQILKTDLEDGSTSLINMTCTMDLGSTITSWGKWSGSVVGPDDNLYGIPFNHERILKFNPKTKESTLVDVSLCISSSATSSSDDNGTSENGYNILKKNGTIFINGIDKYSSAAVVGRAIYFIPHRARKILRFCPYNLTIAFVGNDLGPLDAKWFGAIVSPRNGCVYCIPRNERKVLEFDPTTGCTKLIGRQFGQMGYKWSGGAIGLNGNIYGIPSCHGRILEIDVSTKKTGLVGHNLGSHKGKWAGGVVGEDKCIYMIPNNAKAVLRYNPLTNAITKIGEHIVGCHSFKFHEGVLKNDAYIYALPLESKRVLKIASWNNWFYLKLRLLVEQRRCTLLPLDARTTDRDLMVVQYFIAHSIDDIFRTIIEYLPPIL